MGQLASFSRKIFFENSSRGGKKRLFRARYLSGSSLLFSSLEREERERVSEESKEKPGNDLVESKLASLSFFIFCSSLAPLGQLGSLFTLHARLLSRPLQPADLADRLIAGQFNQRTSKLALLAPQFSPNWLHPHPVRK